MRLPGLIVSVCVAVLAPSMLVHAGGLRMGESSASTTLASNECACQAMSPATHIVATTDADASGVDNEPASATCLATPGNKPAARCTGTAAASATGKADSTVGGAPRKLRGGVRWQSLLPGVMK